MVSGVVAAHVINIGTALRWLFNLTLQPIYPAPILEKVGRTPEASGRFEEEKKLFTCLEFGPNFSSCPARILGVIEAELWMLLNKTTRKFATS